VLAALTALSGLGLGWVGNLATPGTVRSWDAPATSIGMALTGLAHILGVGISMDPVLAVTRMIGLLVAVAAGIWLLKESDRLGQLTSIGLTLLIFVLLGPVVQPWYLTWGLVILACVADGRVRSTLIVLSVVSPFIGLPGGRDLIAHLVHAQPGALAFTFLALLNFVMIPLGRWTAIGHGAAAPGLLAADAASLR
jgi:hypothetical protein